MPCLDLRFKFLNFFILHFKVLDQLLKKLPQRDQQLMSRAFDYAWESRGNVDDSLRHSQTTLSERPRIWLA